MSEISLTPCAPGFSVWRRRKIMPFGSDPEVSHIAKPRSGPALDGCRQLFPQSTAVRLPHNVVATPPEVRKVDHDGCPDCVHARNTGFLQDPAETKNNPATLEDEAEITNGPVAEYMADTEASIGWSSRRAILLTACTKFGH